MTIENANTFKEALLHYGGLQNLIHQINEMIEFYTQLRPIFEIMNSGGMRPNDILDASKPAFISDAVAYRCLSTYQSDEDDKVALERCFTDQLHNDLTLMNDADLGEVCMQDKIWRQYALNSLLRMVLRKKGTETSVSFYLTKDSETQLSDGFRFDSSADVIILTECRHNRSYEMHAENFWEFEELCFRNFRLATEDYGYFVPTFVWLCE